MKLNKNTFRINDIVCIDVWDLVHKCDVFKYYIINEFNPLTGTVECDPIKPHYSNGDITHFSFNNMTKREIPLHRIDYVVDAYDNKFSLRKV